MIKQHLREDAAILKSLFTKSNILLGVILSFILLFILIFNIDCPILHATGISCPGCGMCRAWLHLLTFDFSGAFFYHPLWWAPPLVPVFWLLHQKGAVNDRAYQRFFILFVALFLGTWAVRLLFFRSHVIRFAPEEGSICRFFKCLKSFLIT